MKLGVVSSIADQDPSTVTVTGLVEDKLTVDSSQEGIVLDEIGNIGVIISGPGWFLPKEATLHPKSLSLVERLAPVNTGFSLYSPH